VQEVIAWYKPPKGAKFYFGGKEPLAPTTVDRYFKKYTNAAGLPEIRLHDLRHSFVSLLIHNGANYNIIADLISDTVEMVMKTYSHFYIEDKMQVLALI
jgi:site-specific recombinase XerD